VSFVDTQDGSGLIVEVLPRRNRLARLAAGRKPLEQVIVANVDYVIPVFAAASPAPKWNLLDRYLASAESLGLASLVCITKVDLAGNDRGLDADEVYRSAGYPVVLTSSLTGEGMRALKAFAWRRFRAGQVRGRKNLTAEWHQPGLGAG
jgi:ribosome biogenesis GTPase